MAIQFDPTPYLEAWRLRQAQRPDWNQMVNQPIQMGLQSLIQMQEQKRQQSLEAEKMKLLRDAEARAVAKQRSELGYQGPGEMTPFPTAQRYPYQPSFQGIGVTPSLPPGLEGLLSQRPPLMRSQTLPVPTTTVPTAIPGTPEFDYTQFGIPQEAGRKSLGFKPGFMPGTEGIESMTKIRKLFEKTKEEKMPGFEEEFKLAGQFQALPEVKDYTTVKTQVKSMDSLLKNSLQGNLDSKLALDQALITMFNKLTDPQSVVRESEYARTPENLPMINRISGALIKVQSGGAGMTDDDRQALVIGAKVILNERGSQFEEARKSYIKRANKYGLDPENIVGTKYSFTPYKIEPINIHGKNPIRIINRKTGEKRISYDGGKTWQ